MKTSTSFIFLGLFPSEFEFKHIDVNTRNDLKTIGWYQHRETRTSTVLLMNVNGQEKKRSTAEKRKRNDFLYVCVLLFLLCLVPSISLHRPIAVTWTYSDQHWTGQTVILPFPLFLPMNYSHINKTLNWIVWNRKRRRRYWHMPDIIIKNKTSSPRIRMNRNCS